MSVLPIEEQDAKLRFTSADLKQRLASRYPAPAFAGFPEVRNGTGMQQSRTLDWLAMSVWPSRGLELYGFEIKCSRADWLKERKTPAKADPFIRYLHEFWMVAPEGVALADEIPATWGWLAPKGLGLTVKKRAPKLTPERVSWAFLAALLRRASEPDQAAITEAVRLVTEKKNAEMAEAAKGWRKTGGFQTEKLQALIDQFEAASGVKLEGYNGGQIGAAVREVLSGKLPQHRRELDRLKSLVESLLSALEEHYQENRNV